MIRREPTLILMTDLDVQDVRDVVAKQKAELANHQSLLSKMKRLADNPNLTKEDVEMFDRFKDGMSKAKRLGLDSSAGRHYPLLLTNNNLINSDRFFQATIVNIPRSSNILEIGHHQVIARSIC